MTRVLRAALAALTIFAVCVGVQLASGTSATAQTAQDRVVSDVPAAFTPQVKDGQVNSITQVGGTIVLGGTFTMVTPSGGSPSYSRSGVVAASATTGAINTGFNPALNGDVNSVEPGPTSTTVYVAGTFSTANGVASKGVALLNLSDGSLAAGWKGSSMNGIVEDVQRVGNRLYVAGRFTSVSNTPHGGLVTLSATTGQLDPFMNSNVAGHHNYNGVSGANAAVGAENLAVSPDGTRMVAIGNFKTVDGLPRDQAVMFDLTGASPVVRPDWQTHGYEAACFSNAFDSYIRDVDFAPDGSYFVIVATGGPNPGTLCDTASRWETTATGSDVRPTWVDDTGGDTLFSVAVSGTAVYVGGHERWQNNAGGRDSAAPGSVPRPGLAGLDPKTGVPFSWNPGRQPRGAGAYALYASAAGLWVGSDTTYIGNFEYWRPRIAFFPLTGGKVVGPGNQVALPANVYLGSPSTAGAGGAQIFRVNAGGPTIAATDNGPDWSGDDSADSPFRNSGSNAAGWSPSATISASVPSSTPSGVFDSERWDPGSPGDGGEMHWSFPEPAGTSTEVRLYFANRCTCTSGVGQRVFDVALDGQRVLDHYDIVAGSGDQTAVMKSYTVTSDGTIDIDLAHEIENPLVNAIEIVPAGVTAPPADSLARRFYDGTTATAATAGATGGPAWGSVRGAVVVDGTLFYGRTDGQLYRRTFDGATFGPETLIDPYNDPKWSTVDTGSGQTYRGVLPTLYGQLTTVTAFAYSNGKLFYTRSGQDGLFYRLFNPESGIVSQEFAVAGVSLPQITGMFVSGASFYYVQQTTGDLHRQTFANDVPTGNDAIVSGPASDGVDWRAKALFVGPGPMPNQAPAAAFTQNCSALSCTFSGATSTDPDGTISSYAWAFGDGGTASGVSVSHVFSAAGTYSVKLTVTDNGGATASTVVDITVAPPAASPISFVGVAKTAVNATTASVQVPAGVATGDGELLFVTRNDSTVNLAAPTGLTGWQLVGSPTSATMATTVYQRVATAGDSGATVTVTAPQIAKYNLQLAVYHGTSASGPVAAWTTAADANSATHASPAVTVADGRSWVLSYWGDKSSTTNSWTAPSSVTARDVTLNTGSGRVTALIADSGAAVPAGSYGNLQATTNAVGSRGLMVSVVIAPA